MATAATAAAAKRVIIIAKIKPGLKKKTDRIVPEKVHAEIKTKNRKDDDKTERDMRVENLIKC